MPSLIVRLLKTLLVVLTGGLRRLRRWGWLPRERCCVRRRVAHDAVDSSRTRSRRKPAWVQREVLRHAALQPEASCRLLANAFNRRHAGRDGITVGKSYVHALRRQQRSSIACAAARPFPLPR